MKTMKRSECAVLPLVLKGKWYRMIESGEKLEEYRDATQYWKTRIENWMRQNPKKHTVVAFSKGYRKPDMFFLAYPYPPEIWWPKEIRDRQFGHPEWGEPTKPHYVIQLFDRLELTEGE